MCNVGNKDQVIRFFLGIALLVVGPFLGSILGFILVGAGVIAVLTSVFNFCPLYAIFRINTSKE